MVSERKKEVLYGPTRVSYTHHGHFLMFIFFFVRLFPFILKQNKDSAHLRKGCFFFFFFKINKICILKQILNKLTFI